MAGTPPSSAILKIYIIASSSLTDYKNVKFFVVRILFASYEASKFENFAKNSVYLLNIQLGNRIDSYINKLLSLKSVFLKRLRGKALSRGSTAVKTQINWKTFWITVGQLPIMCNLQNLKFFSKKCIFRDSREYETNLTFVFRYD